MKNNRIKNHIENERLLDAELYMSRYRHTLEYIMDIVHSDLYFKPFNIKETREMIKESIQSTFDGEPTTADEFNHIVRKGIQDDPEC